MTSILPTFSGAGGSETANALQAIDTKSNPTVSFDAVFKGLNYKDLALQSSSLSNGLSGSGQDAGQRSAPDRQRQDAVADTRQDRQAFTAADSGNNEVNAGQSTPSRKETESDRRANQTQTVADGDNHDAPQVASADSAVKNSTNHDTGSGASPVEAKPTGQGAAVVADDNSAAESNVVPRSAVTGAVTAAATTINPLQAVDGELVTGDMLAKAALVDSSRSPAAIPEQRQSIPAQSVTQLLSASGPLVDESSSASAGSTLKDTFTVFGSTQTLVSDSAKNAIPLENIALNKELPGGSQILSAALSGSSSIGSQAGDSFSPTGQELNALLAQMRGALSAGQSPVGAISNGAVDSTPQTNLQQSSNPLLGVNTLSSSTIPLPLQLDAALSRVMQNNTTAGEGSRVDMKVGALVGAINAAPTGSGSTSSSSVSSGSGPSNLNLPGFMSSTNNPGEWPGEFAGKLKMMLSQRLQSAELQLNPAGLGNLHIKIEGAEDQAKVLFSVQNGLAKEQIEMHMPRLRELMANSQIDLGDVNVQQQDAGQESPSGFADSSGQRSHADSIVATGEHGIDQSSAIELNATISDQLLDTYV